MVINIIVHGGNRGQSNFCIFTWAFTCHEDVTSLCRGVSFARAWWLNKITRWIIQFRQAAFNGKSKHNNDNFSRRPTSASIRYVNRGSTGTIDCLCRGIESPLPVAWRDHHHRSTPSWRIIHRGTNRDSAYSAGSIISVRCSRRGISLQFGLTSWPISRWMRHQPSDSKVGSNKRRDISLLLGLLRSGENAARTTIDHRIESASRSQVDLGHAGPTIGFVFQRWNEKITFNSHKQCYN